METPKILKSITENVFVIGLDATLSALCCKLYITKLNSHKYCSTKFADCKAFAAKKGIKLQNHLNLNIAIKALLFIFKNKGMGLDFLYTFFTCFIFISSSYNFFYNIMLIMFLPPSSVVFYIISRIFSILLRCSVPVEII